MLRTLFVIVLLLLVLSLLFSYHLWTIFKEIQDYPEEDLSFRTLLTDRTPIDVYLKKGDKYLTSNLALGAKPTKFRIWIRSNESVRLQLHEGEYVCSGEKIHFCNAKLSDWELAGNYVVSGATALKMISV